MPQVFAERVNETTAPLRVHLPVEDLRPQLVIQRNQLAVGSQRRLLAGRGNALLDGLEPVLVVGPLGGRQAVGNALMAHGAQRCGAAAGRKIKFATA